MTFVKTVLICYSLAESNSENACTYWKSTCFSVAYQIMFSELKSVSINHLWFLTKKFTLFWYLSTRLSVKFFLACLYLYLTYKKINKKDTWHAVWFLQGTKHIEDQDFIMIVEVEKSLTRYLIKLNYMLSFLLRIRLLII